MSMVGHLAWAWHNDTPDYWLKVCCYKKAADYIKPYSFGALCPGSGNTVMTYAEKVLPVYSSPNIQYYGKACGDARKSMTTQGTCESLLNHSL
ncbi:hypothetical protein OK016_21095 [Vibrio chagasii]|nr:hypothetical protein [Vibrio chagasii]